MIEEHKLEDRLKEIGDRLDNTQGGDWKYFKEGRDHQCGSDFIMTGEGGERGEDLEITGATEGDMEFIGSAKSDIKYLLFIIETLQKNK